MRTPVNMPCPMPGTPEQLRTLLLHALEKALEKAPEGARGFSFHLLIEGETYAAGCTLHGGVTRPFLQVKTFIRSLAPHGGEEAILRDLGLHREEEPHTVQ